MTGFDRSAVVTGATGAIGPALVSRLVAEGWRVTAMARRDPPVGLLPPEATFVGTDICDTGALARAMPPGCVVFHLAACAHVVDRSRAAEIARFNIDGTRAVMMAAREARAARVVHASSVAVYGLGSAGTVFDEDSPVAPASVYARTKAEAERVVLGDPACEVVVLRLGAVYGPRLRGRYRALFDTVARGRFVGFGHGRNHRAVVFLDDVVSACRAVAIDARAAGRVFNVTDNHQNTVADIISAMAAAAGAGRPRWIPDLGTLALARRLASIYRRIDLTPPPVVVSAETFLSDLCVSSQRIHAELDLPAPITLGEGWRRTAAALPRV